MEFLQQYILSLIAATLLSGLLSSFTENTFAKDWIRLIIGLFLTLVVLFPFVESKIDFFAELPFPDFQDAQKVVGIGEDASRNAEAALIIEKTGTYILDKAAVLDMVLDVEVFLNDNLVPQSVLLRGNNPLSSCKELEKILESELGITKENQIWSG